jgi:predicted metal-dependent HD superfamily phosphohydrolase
MSKVSAEPYHHQSEQHVTSLFRDADTSKLIYHNINHTRSVVKATELIGRYDKVSEKDLEVAITAAWFHDVGYLVDIYNHEKAGIEMMKEYFTGCNAPKEFIHEVSMSILSTRMPQSPGSKVAEVVCDADMHHLASPDFLKLSSLFREEQKILFDNEFSDEEFMINNLRFMHEQSYFTRYGKEQLQTGKMENIKQVELLVKDY